MTSSNLASSPVSKRSELLEVDRLTRELARRRARQKLFGYYPDGGPLRRELYPKHLEFFRAGATYRERCVLAANRIGKTEGMGGFETALHLTGRYPAWWDGRRFDRPVTGWAAGKLKETTRDIVQTKLFGPVGFEGNRRVCLGTGLVPGDDIGAVTWRQGVTNLADTVMVRHHNAEGRHDGWSRLGLKSFEQGRQSFEGTEQHFIWLDEEPPHDVYNECLIRTATTHGIVMLTYTPLDGITEVVEEFMAGIGIGPVPGSPSRYTVNAGWDDVPHLDEQTKAELLRSTKKYLRDARSKGIPALGTGVIFPVDDDAITCRPFKLPDHWPRICGHDFGWDHPTADAWLALDPDTDTIYLYDEYAESEQPIAVHAAAIKARGDWIPVAWPHDGLQHEKGSGIQLAEQYRDQGCAMLHDHAQFDTTGEDEETRVSRTSVEAGLHEMLTRMQDGRWKVFDTCQGWLREKAIYRREKGKVVKLGDDRISASRYGMMMLRYAETPPAARRDDLDRQRLDWRFA
jgi:phage terminase large subunit-like protein